MSEGLFQLKSDYRQSDGLDELRAEAWIYGFKLEFIIDPDATPEEAARGSTSLPEQAEEILYELLTKHYLRLCEALNAERRARGQKPIGDPAKLAKQKADFEKAYYGRLRHSEKGRRAVDALRAWRGAQIAQQRGYQVTDSSRIAEMEKNTPKLLGMPTIWHAQSSPFCELARVLVRPDHVASGIINADHGVM